MDFTVFSTDRAYFNAVSMCVLQIGELANSLSSEYREETKDQMPWGMIRGMRNWIAHAYSEMDEETIWETVITNCVLSTATCAQGDSGGPVAGGGNSSTRYLSGIIIALLNSNNYQISCKATNIVGTLGVSVY